ncbi:YcaO-like family protein [Chitinimonas lacunae]|uniref:YcaO-like family protein n=1 Tax=Chitinimonas lacunae TaxID=1963018 RepID=A0ABV8MNU4_9NEIS
MMQNPVFSDRFQEVYRALVAPKTGIIRRLVDLPLQPDEAPLFISAATCTTPQYFSRNATPEQIFYTVQANGVGFTREDCLWSVMGEACERYASGIYFEDELVEASIAEMGDAAVDMTRFIAYDEAQYANPDFPWRRLARNQPLRWTPGKSLKDGREVYLPAYQVWMGCVPRLAGEMCLPQLSTGQGAGATLEQAILSGLNEVVERDSFTSAWLLRYSPPQLRFGADIDPRLAGLLNIPRLGIRVLDISTDLGLPCYLTLLTPEQAGGVAVGASANRSAMTALLKSVMEAHHTRNWTIELARTAEKTDERSISDFEHHVRFYLHPEQRHRLQFLHEGPVQTFQHEPDTESIPERLAASIAALERAGFEAFYVDITPADLASIGIHTVKVIVPGLQPLHVGYGTEHRDPRRLKQVAAHWGLDWPRALNSDPHPFP